MNKRELKNNKNMTPPTGTKDYNLEGVRHQEGPFLLGMRVFFGHYYACKNFGHKVIHYKINARNNYMRNTNDYGYPKGNHVNSRSRNSHGFVNINYNPFDPLMDQNIVCHK
jgi:hypothetical protein